MAIKSDRLKYIDFLRGLAILLVILGHAIQFSDEKASSANILYCFIYSFHMPLFMFLSGFVSGYKDYLDIRDFKKRALQLLVPFFCWPFAVGLTDWNNFSFQIYPHIVDKPDCGLWFLWVLFFIFAIFVGCSYLSKWSKIKIEYLTGAIAIMLPGIYMITRYNHFGFAQISWQFVFFWLGYILQKKEPILFFITKKWFYVVLLFVVLFVSKYALDHSVYQSAAAYLPSIAIKSIEYFFNVVVAICGIAMSYGLLRYIYENRQLQASLWGRVEYLGQISLGIYAIQFSILNLFIQSFMGLPLPAVITLSFILSTILSVCIVQGMLHNRYLSFLLLGKKQIKI